MSFPRQDKREQAPAIRVPNISVFLGTFLDEYQVEIGGLEEIASMEYAPIPGILALNASELYQVAVQGPYHPAKRKGRRPAKAGMVEV
jgi:hypothetical protein